MASIEPCDAVATDVLPNTVLAEGFFPQAHDLRETLPPLADQGQERQTCVAFAAVTVVAQFRRRVAQDTRLLSPQFLYWACKQHDGYPHLPGSLLRVAFQCLAVHGCCLDETWPYDMYHRIGNECGGPPPNGAEGEAQLFRIPPHPPLPARDVARMRATIAAGFCVAVTIPAFTSWFRNPQVAQSGDIIRPYPGEHTTESHTMCLVGFNDADGGYFIVRNSWNGRWGIASPFGPGYGRIPYAFLANYGIEAYTLG